jgi:cyclopropane fatty-acyl-phospholipid synthase-like methyltransferase
MGRELSGRLAEIVAALPLQPGMRVLEIGCGPGAMAREMASRIGTGHVLAIDRSAKAIAQAIAGSAKEMKMGAISFRQVAVEDFVLMPDEKPYDIAVAVRVGVLDGRHPKKEAQAFKRIAASLTRKGSLFIDGGTPLKEISLAKFRGGR